ncbi:winged helix DNA-binding domain-containing protein [Lichtheimia hyalospora FSU 10163]|nr:winged helix DNA-binding domain-containing protein [Lichtheimia hyalospora FSU 10163]
MPATSTKSGSSKKTPEHPPYEAMIKAAILSLKERKGSSRPAIKKYILANYKVSSGAHFDTQIAAAIKRGAAKNIFALPRGLSGTVKLVKPEKKSTTEKKDKETKGDKKSSTESKATSTKKKASTTKKAPKSAAAKKAALAKKQPSKQKTATKQNVKAPRKKSASSTGTTTTTKKTAAIRKKATAKA